MFDPERISDLGRIDAVFLTHKHGDHADPVALEPIGRLTSAQIVGPESCVAVAREAGCPADRCRVLARDEAMTIGDLRVTAVKIHDPGAKGCSGYVLETSGLAVLHAGDSTYFPGFVDLGRRWALDAICLSVGSNPPGKNFYMDEVDAARAARDANAKTLIPQHFDLWQGITLDPRRVVTVSRWYCPETRVMPARLGRRLTLDAPA